MSEEADPAGQTPQIIVKTPKFRNKMILFIDALISEVKKRPYLWDKKHQHYGCRTKVSRSWQIIAANLKKRPDEVKAKWRNLKDSFHRLEKRLELPPEEEGGPRVSYYTGQWIHFEKLLFLRDTRQGRRTSNEEFVDADIPEICIEDIKGELDDTEHSNTADEHSEDNNEEPEKIFAEPVITLQSVLNGANLAANSDSNASGDRKRILIDSDIETTEGKRRMIDLAPDDAVIDEDLHFVKSLVPFLRKLNPIRKLIVRNEMQNLLIKEMLCDNCRSYGPQPNCRCSLS